MLIKLLDNVQKYLIFWILGAIVAGLSFMKLTGGYAFSSVICFVAALIMIYPSLVPLAFGKFKEVPKNYKIIVLSLIFNFIISPLLATAIGYLFLRSYPILWLGLLLISILPGGGMATSWALRSKAEMTTTVGIILVNLLAMIFIVPSFLSFVMNRLEGSVQPAGGMCVLSEVTGGAASCFLGNAGQISPSKIIFPIFFIIVIPMLLAYFTQTEIKKKKGAEYFDRIKSNFGKFSNLGLVVVLFMLMGIKNNIVIFKDPSLILAALLPLILFYFIYLAIILFVYFVFYKNEKGKAGVWGTYLRYITLALGLAISLIYQNGLLMVMVVIISLAYFIQIPSSFLLSRLLINN